MTTTGRLPHTDRKASSSGARSGNERRQLRAPADHLHAWPRNALALFLARPTDRPQRLRAFRHRPTNRPNEGTTERRTRTATTPAEDLCDRARERTSRATAPRPWLPPSPHPALPSPFCLRYVSSSSPRACIFACFSRPCLTPFCAQNPGIGPDDCELRMLLVNGESFRLVISVFSAVRDVKQAVINEQPQGMFSPFHFPCICTRSFVPECFLT